LQGVGDGECIFDEKSNSTISISSDPLFSVNVYFGIISVIVLISTLSFWLINRKSLFANFFSKGSTNDENLGYDIIKRSSESNNWGLYYFILFMICFLSNGFLPSIMSYVTMPYGLKAAHLAAVINTLSNPMACGVIFIWPFRSKSLYSFIFVITLMLSAWHLVKGSKIFENIEFFSKLFFSVLRAIK
jgi:riboflavin transporter 2